jgi:NAD(P)H dehydrogenase (quinone)
VLQGKVGGAFASSARQHGGQETTLFTIITNLLHFGMTVVGLNYGFAGQMKVDEITGGAPYGATTIAGLDAQRQPSENELSGARYHVRAIAEDRREAPQLNDAIRTRQGAGRVGRAIERNGCW